MLRLSVSQLEAIDRTSLRILGQIGVRVEDEALRSLALRNGAQEGLKAQWILLPEEMVRGHVSLAPRRVRLAQVGGACVKLCAGGEPTFWTGAALNYVMEDGVAAVTSDDLAQFARVADSLESVFAVVGTSLADYPPPVRDFVGLRVLSTNCGRHLRPLLFHPANVPTMIEMAQVIAGGRPLREHPVLSLGYSCLSPLHWALVASEMWRLSSGHGIAVMVNGEPVAGATSPVTLAGSLALSHAEILAGIVLIQLLEPGRPVVHNLGFAHSLDMRTTACLSGNPESALMAAAGAQLAARWGLPSASWVSTESVVPDEQATMEKMQAALCHVLGGVNILWGMGQLESQKALSPLQLVIDHEIAQYLRRLWRGVG
jgi:trimethylamine--corrinoid protein Co-methyltransferase